MGLLNKFLNEESGQGLVEYALIIALVSIAVVTALTALRKEVADVFKKIGEAMKGVNANGSNP